MIATPSLWDSWNLPRGPGSPDLVERPLRRYISSVFVLLSEDVFLQRQPYVLFGVEIVIQLEWLHAIIQLLWQPLRMVCFLPKVEDQPM